MFGSVVNKAARVAGVAEAGEIRVSDEVRLAALDDAESLFSSPRVVSRHRRGKYFLKIGKNTNKF